ncbi:MAG: xanthine dehydrogenase family protein molybdopterin-binding subunit [Proteobacteria bacterium]|nr:xanthine dehydrogenase family protein molybdopterin-binding subunit [Pseudomonadota bacterium]
MADGGIGERVLRKEDFRFLTGAGNYTDDINRPNQCFAVLVRSPHAHAKIQSVDAAAAQSAPNVIAVFTGADILADGIGSLPCGWGITQTDGSPMAEPPHALLQADRVRHVGDPVALVIAETREAARDAADFMDVTYEILPAVTDTAATAVKGAPQVHEEAPNNTCFDWEIGDANSTDAAFATAAHLTTLDLVNTRMVTNAMEPRTAVGDYDAGGDRYTLYTSSQAPHVIRLLMGAFVLNIPEHKLRVVSPDVGGGFGSKIFHYAEEALVTWASKKVGRPVKWTAERSESFVSDAQGRDHVSRAELAMDKNGAFLGLRVRTTANLGAYLSSFAPLVPTYLYATLLAGQYATPAIHCTVKAVFSHTVPVDALRGAGRPEATYLIERLVDQAAAEIGVDPAELRRRNFIAADAFPYQTPVALTYDSGNYQQALESSLSASDYAGFDGRRVESATRGKLRGIGLAAYIEACGAAPSAIAGALGARAGLYESGQVRFHPTGTVTVFTGSQSQGQGHETTFAQIVSDRLGVPVDNVDVIHGDTDRIPFGMGTYGSRSLAVGGSALAKAMDKIIAKGKKIASHILEASESDIEFAAGKFTVAGTDKEIGIAEVAMAAYVPHNYPLEELEPGLDESAFYDPANFTFPFGAQVCELEIDEETGTVDIIKFTAVDDFGRIINPMIVEGQVHGGIAHGIGQALLENCVYDKATGQLLTGSYNDYSMPRADNVPSYDTATQETLCPHNPLGVKGCGEAGTIGAGAAVMNAVVNALSTRGISHIDMPATAHNVWQAIRNSKGRMA